MRNPPLFLIFVMNSTVSLLAVKTVGSFVHFSLTNFFFGQFVKDRDFFKKISKHNAYTFPKLLQFIYLFLSTTVFQL